MNRIKLFIFVAPLIIFYANSSLALTCSDLEGASVYSAEFSSVYLGFFGSSVAAESINNTFGTYGSQFNSLSVRNSFGSYGSDFGVYSANNDFSSSPPFIYKHGIVLGRLSTNAFVTGNVSLAEIDFSCGSGFFSFSPAPQHPETTFVFASDGTLEDSILVTWGSSLGANFYEVIRATQSSMTDAIFLAQAFVESWFDILVTPEQIYYYQVRACNDFGCSLYSNVESGVAAIPSPPDADNDGIPDVSDNCPQISNVSQLDADGDGQGDACDPDDDNDGIADNQDAFPNDPTEWDDTDADGVGDNADAFPNDPNESVDTDGDGIGNNADPDDDNDGIADNVDPFPVGQFTDVPPAAHWAFSFIERLGVSGITSGCGNGNYCPDGSVTRAQMAVFLERGIHGSSFSPPAASGNAFLDVAATDFAASFIEQFSLDGITSGCGNNNYCPEVEVTRDQMAVFLLRAKYGAGYSPPPASGVFGDVNLSHWAVHWIEQLAAEGITSGCGNGNYCPDAVVTRDQMAVFLVRTFGL